MSACFAQWAPLQRISDNFNDVWRATLRYSASRLIHYVTANIKIINRVSLREGTM
jgi:hypothetical protein